jgi:hypothetical protein
MARFRLLVNIFQIQETTESSEKPMKPPPCQPNFTATFPSSSPSGAFDEGCLDHAAPAVGASFLLGRSPQEGTRNRFPASPLPSSRVASTTVSALRIWPFGNLRLAAD